MEMARRTGERQTLLSFVSSKSTIYYTYYEYPSIHMVKQHYGIRTQRYKLIHFYHDIDEWELYDLKKDSHEMKNVYDDPTYLEVRKNMRQKLEELRKKHKDSNENNYRFIQASAS